MRISLYSVKNWFPAIFFFGLAIVMSSVFNDAKIAAMCGFFAGYFACRAGQERKL